MGKPTVVLGANTPTVSVSDFFAQDNILIGGSILNNNCLPEGSYVFCFQAFDANAYYSGQRIPISKEFSFAAFLEGGATPILFFPQDRDSIACEMPAINFQWQQPYVTSGLNTYTLQIAESNSQFDGPHIVENPGNLLIEKKGLMTTMCNIEVTSATFQPNHTYYWRVVMCDKNGTPRANYPNKGASPVYKFVYCGEKQEPEPEDPWVQQVPMAKAIGEGLDTLRIDSVSTEDLSSSMAVWFRDSMEIRSKYDGVIIEVKKKTQDTWTPFKLESKEINDTTVALSSLAYRDTFMARGQYYQLVDGNTVYAPYSDTVYFAIKHPADTLDCGAPLPDLTDCSQSGERSEFKIGDEFSANGTTVSIDSITSQTVNGSSVTITGQGHLPFPILSNFGLKVEFENIEINCDNQLKKGEVVSMYDEKTAAMIDLNNIIGKGSAGNDLEQSDASFDESGTGGSGSLNADADGNVTITDADGNKITIGKVIDLSSSSVYNNNTSLKDKNVYVKFSNPDYEHIAFDDDETKLIRKPASLSVNYRDYGGGYIIPWVATNPGRVFQIKATPSSDLKQNGYKDIKFVFPASGKHVELNVEETDGVYSVSLPGMTENIQYNVYAIARKSDKDPYENVGKLNLCCYSYKTKKVVVVPLVENLHPNAEDIKTALNKIYGKLGYTFEVEVDDNAEHIQNLEDGVELESSLFSEFSADMKKTISAYKSNIGDSYDNTAAYLFLMNKPSGEYADANGIMPQKQQFGFVFMQGSSTVSSAETRTMAHELGHGLFGLDHTFLKTYGIPKGETNNLMDYTTKTPDDFLSYHEWAQIDQPVASWSLFNSDEDNMDNDGWYTIKSNDDFHWYGTKSNEFSLESQGEAFRELMNHFYTTNSTAKYKVNLKLPYDKEDHTFLYEKRLYECVNNIESGLDITHQLGELKIKFGFATVNFSFEDESYKKTDMILYRYNNNTNNSYVIKSIDELKDNKYVKVGYYKNSNNIVYGLICFYSTGNDRLTFIIQIKLNSAEKAKSTMLSWAEYLLKGDRLRYKSILSESKEALKENEQDNAHFEQYKKLYKNVVKTIFYESDFGYSATTNTDQASFPNLTSWLYVKTQNPVYYIELNRSDLEENDSRVSVVTDSDDAITISESKVVDKKYLCIKLNILTGYYREGTLIPAIKILDPKTGRLLRVFYIIYCAEKKFNLVFCKLNNKGGNKIADNYIDKIFQPLLIKNVYEPVGVDFNITNTEKEIDYSKVGSLNNNKAIRKISKSEVFYFGSMLHGMRIDDGTNKDAYYGYLIDLPFDGYSGVAERINSGQSGTDELFTQAINKHYKDDKNKNEIAQTNYPEMNSIPYFVVSCTSTYNYVEKTKENICKYTAAHEMGHNIFGFYHPFEENSIFDSKGKDPYNLMDYEGASLRGLRAYQVLRLQGYWFTGKGVDIYKIK